VSLASRVRLLASSAAALAAATASAAAQTPAAPAPAPPVPGPPLGVTGTVRFHASVPSRAVAARHVEVWLPPGYDRDRGARYPVLYLHDGQNVFAPATSYTGVDWGVDETMTRLVAARRVRAAIVVAVWNSPARFAEYMPEKALSAGGGPVPSGVPGVGGVTARPLADAYLRFLVAELKPLVDRTYRTRPGRADTFVMGSSMGGLISLYALAEYPGVFGGAAALSTHWPAAAGAAVPYLARALPRAGAHRVYMDHGTATLDSLYAPYQARADSAMRAAGYAPGRDWATRVFPGAEHSERAWRARVDGPLEFLLGR
jgi:predicted alpha/beta superfamily hydrolase